MLMGVRMYENEQNARDAATKLVEADLVSEEYVLILTPDPGNEEEVVQQAIRDRKLPDSHVRSAAEGLKEGRSILSIPMPYEGKLATEIMDSCGSVGGEALPEYRFHDPTPFSDLLGLKVLTEGESSARLLTGNEYMFRSFLGLPLLKKSDGTKETSFGLPLLKESVSQKESSFGLPLLSQNGTPLSSMFGMKLLSRPKDGE